MEKENINQAFFTLLNRLMEDGTITEGVEFRVEYKLFLRIRLKCLYPHYIQELRKINEKSISFLTLHNSLKSSKTCDVEMSGKNYRFKGSPSPTGALVFFHTRG